MEDLIDSLVPLLGEMAAKELADQLVDLSSESSEPWKKTVLALVSTSVELYGVDGIQIAVEAIRDLMDGDSGAPVWVDLATGSDLLAQLQNAEASRKSEAKEFLQRTGHVLGQLLGGIIKGMIA